VAMTLIASGQSLFIGSPFSEIAPAAHDVAVAAASSPEWDDYEKRYCTFLQGLGSRSASASQRGSAEPLTRRRVRRFRHD
jgi:hypothetical protein